MDLTRNAKRDSKAFAVVGVNLPTLDLDLDPGRSGCAVNPLHRRS